MDMRSSGGKFMGRKKTPELSFIDWGGKVAGAVGVLAIAAYIAGYAKFYFMYKALGCGWVLSLHSVQEVVSNGALDVFLCSLSAIPLFYYYPRSIDVDNKGRRIVGFILIGIITSFIVLVTLLGLKVDAFLIDLIIYCCSYLFYGVVLALSARYALEKGRSDYLLGALVAFVYSTIFSSYLVYQYKDFSKLDSDGAFTFEVSSDLESAGVLITSVNGRYLTRQCGSRNKYQLIVPSYRWSVDPRSEHGCDSP
jgi:hypothetical protein